MRIAYIAPYQGSTLVNRRPTTLNRSLSQTLKVELIASLLRASGHDVDIISQGEVVEHTYKFYPAFDEPKPVHGDVRVHYASALPVPKLNGLWSSLSTLQIFKALHREVPYNLVIIWNVKGPQLACANHAIRRLRIPVVLEYEDALFVDRSGQPEKMRLMTRYSARACRQLFKVVSGCMAVSPYLLSQLPDDIPKILLRGVVGEDLIHAGNATGPKKPMVLFSGTHAPANGIEQLLRAWSLSDVSGWELHVTGHGQQTDQLRAIASGMPRVHFHGLVSRERLVELMSSAAICINPHEVSHSPGHLFAFKIIEYLAAGAHVVTTPMGTLEKELEAGMTYMPDNSPETISGTLAQVIGARQYEQTAMPAAHERYGPAAVATSIDTLLALVQSTSAQQRNGTLSRVSPHSRA